MVKYAAAAFEALADPTRRAMVDRLSRGPCRVGDLAQPFAMSLPAATKHISVLCAAGIVRKERRGREQWCSLDARPLRLVADWADRRAAAWEARAGRLAAHLATGEER